MMIDIKSKFRGIEFVIFNYPMYSRFCAGKMIRVAQLRNR